MTSKRLKAQRYLTRIRAINIHIDKKLEDLLVLEAKATRVTSTIDREHVQSSVDDKMAEAVIKIVELKEDIAKQIDKFVSMKKEAENIVNQILEPDLVSIIYGRYFLGNTFFNIANEIGYSERYVYKLHDLALDAVAEIMDKTVHNSSY